MNSACRQVLERLGHPLRSELSAHVQTCDVCKQVVESYEGLGRLKPDTDPHPRPPPPFDEAADRRFAGGGIFAGWRRPAAAVIALNVLFASVGALALAHGHLTMGPLQPPGILIGVLLVAVLTVGPWIALSPRRRAARTALLGLFFALGAILVVTHPFGMEPGFIRSGIPCLVIEASMSLVPLAIGLWVLTNSAFNPSRAALLALSGGTAGLFALHTHCENDLAPHLLAFHVLPWLALMGALIWVRARLPSKSFVP